LQAEEEKAREKNTRQERLKQDSWVSGVHCKAKNGNKTHKNSILPKNGTGGGPLAGRKGGREGSSSLLAIFFLDLVIEACKQNKNSKIYKVPTTTKDHVL
jgi:hypothetical protein